MLIRNCLHITSRLLSCFIKSQRINNKHKIRDYRTILSIFYINANFLRYGHNIYIFYKVFSIDNKNAWGDVTLFNTSFRSNWISWNTINKNR